MIKQTALLCVLSALVGCVASTDPVGEPENDPPQRVPVWTERVDDGDDVLEQVEANLARLRALDVFEVGELVVDVPHDASEAAIREAEKEAALRLTELVIVAEAAAGEPGSYLCTELIDENLDALRALEVVEIEGLVEDALRSDPACGNQPCQEDIDAANARNEQRAAALDSIARATSGL